MAPRIVLRPRAVVDIGEQAEYLAESNLNVAGRFTLAMERAFRRLASMPGIGTLWETPNPQYAGMRIGRIRGFKKHLIFYRPIENGIEVIRVLHGARDLKKVFEQ